MNPAVAHALAAVAITLASLTGIALTLITLPGAWIALLTAVSMQVWQPDLYSWWTLVICGLLALMGEVMELVASAAGAAKGGASRSGAAAAIAGSLVGAIVGSFFIPPVGTVLGAVLGAGLLAAGVELWFNRRTLGQATRAGTGAAAGRLIATIAKTGVTAIIAAVLIIGAWWP